MVMTCTPWDNVGKMRLRDPRRRQRKIWSLLAKLAPAIEPNSLQSSRHFLSFFLSFFFFVFLSLLFGGGRREGGVLRRLYEKCATISLVFNFSHIPVLLAHRKNEGMMNQSRFVCSLRLCLPYKFGHRRLSFGVFGMRGAHQPDCSRLSSVSLVPLPATVWIGMWLRSQ